MSDEVLVTGAAGFIGGHLTRSCADDGFRVTAIDPRPLPPGVAAATGLRGRADSSGLLRDVRAGRYRAVVHQGGITTTTATDCTALLDHNVEQPLALAEACADSNTLFVYASSHSVYGGIIGRVAVAEGDEDDPERCSGPLNRYALSKLALDRAMAGRVSDGLPWVGLRYTNVFGAGEGHKGAMASIISQLLRDAAHEGTLRLFADTLTASRDYVPVETVTRVLRWLLAHPVPPGVYNLGSGSPVSFATLLEWCADFAGSRGVRVQLVPNEFASSYQYWTCADTTRLRAVVPILEPMGTADLRAAASALFRHFASR